MQQPPLQFSPRRAHPDVVVQVPFTQLFEQHSTFDVHLTPAAAHTEAVEQVRVCGSQ